MADHGRVDRAFSRFVLAEPDGYARFLRAQAGAFLPLEDAIEAAGPHAILPDWDARRRSNLLRADLVALGVAHEQYPAAPTLAGAAAVLGVVYVLEGSRLGGAMLAREVPASWPCAFLNAADPALWRSLIEVLDAVLITDEDRTAAIRAAHRAFAAFERSAHRQLELADLA